MQRLIRNPLRNAATNERLIGKKIRLFPVARTLQGTRYCASTYFPPLGKIKIKRKTFVLSYLYTHMYMYVLLLSMQCKFERFRVWFSAHW